MKAIRYFWLLLLIIPSAVAGKERPQLKEKLIEEGRARLIELQRQNLVNDSKGRGHLNQYVIYVRPNAEEYITQLRGSRGGEPVGELMLSTSELEHYNAKLVTLNSRRNIQTYVILIDYIPIEFTDAIPDDQTISEVLQRRNRGTDEQVKIAIDASVQEAKSIIEAIASPVLNSGARPTLYCGLVNLKVYLQKETRKRLSVYYPAHSRTFERAAEFKRLLNRSVSEQKDWVSNSAKANSLINAIERSLDQQQKLGDVAADLFSIKSADLLLEKLSGVEATSFAGFDVAQRLHIINLLTSTTLPAKAEVVVLNTLITCPEPDHKALLQELIKPNPFVTSNKVASIKLLVQRMHDAVLVFGGNHNQRLHQQLIAMTTNDPQRSQSLASLPVDEFEKRVVNWRALDITRQRIKTVDLLDDGSVRITREKQIFYSVNGGGQIMSGQMPDYVDVPDPTLLTDPFALVAFINHGKLSLLNEATQSGVGEMTFVPAITLYYAQEKQENDNMATAAFIALDAVTIATSGGAALATKVGLFRRAWLITEVVGATGNIVVNTTNLSSNPSLKGFVDKYNALMALVGVINLQQAGMSKLLEQAENGSFFGNVRVKVKDFVEEGYRQESILRAVNDPAVGSLLAKRDALSKALGLTDSEIAALREALRGFSNIPDDLLNRLRTKGWNDDLLKRLDNDLADAVLRENVLRNDGLVESWKVFKDANVSDAIRKNPANLERLSKARKQNGYNATYFENLLKSKTDPQKFIDDYVSKLANDGKFVDNDLETDYASYVSRKSKEGKPPRDRADWNEASDYMKYNSPTARGNRFNKKAALEYDINELNLVLDDGSFVRIDTYVPASQSPTGQGMIISRKATDLVDIDESVFRKHLQEMKNKYAPGTEIRSNAYPTLNGKTIEGKQYLQIPESNTTFFDIERYKKIARDEYGIEIIFLAE